MSNSMQPLEPDLTGLIAKITEAFKDTEWSTVFKYQYEDTLKTLGFSYLGGGASRKVYAHKCCNVVIKMQPKTKDWRSEPLNQNVNEVNNWEALPKELRENFAPILAHDKGCHWIIQKRAKIVTEARKEDMKNGNLSTFDDWGVLAEELDNILEENDLGRIGDIYYENIGLIDGEPVIIDYGFRDVSNHIKTKETK